MPYGGVQRANMPRGSMHRSTDFMRNCLTHTHYSVLRRYVLCINSVWSAALCLWAVQAHAYKLCLHLLTKLHWQQLRAEAATMRREPMWRARRVFREGRNVSLPLLCVVGRWVDFKIGFCNKWNLSPSIMVASTFKQLEFIEMSAADACLNACCCCAFKYPFLLGFLNYFKHCA
jgi:hypothetical protein